MALQEPLGPSLAISLYTAGFISPDPQDDAVKFKGEKPIARDLSSFVNIVMIVTQQTAC